ncbi:MAG: T9SS type A sorting domain-containing protein [Bacteroidota bacterium]
MKKIILLFLFLAWHTTNHAQWTTQDIGTGRFHLGAAATDSLLFFVGGTLNGLVPSAAVNIYNTNTQLWSQTELSSRRSFPATVATNDQVFVAGGNDIRTNGASKVVDIYDVATETWSQTELSVARSGIAAVQVGDKVIFAGGGTIDAFLSGFHTSDVVDIYDLTTQTWDTARLSQARFFMAATTAGDKAYFGGGVIDNNTMSKRVDIYDATTDTWSIDSLSIERGLLAATTVQNQVIFAGGHDADGVSLADVDIYDTNTQNWTTDQLSVPRMGAGAVTACGKAYFLGGGDNDWDTKIVVGANTQVDIYDPSTATWTTDNLNAKRALAAAAATDNTLAILGGFDPQSGIQNTAETLVCELISHQEGWQQHPSWQIFPNPNSGQFTLATAQPYQQIILYDSCGKEIIRTTANNTLERFDFSFLPKGLYWVILQNESGMFSSKKIIIEGE